MILGPLQMRWSNLESDVVLTAKVGPRTERVNLNFSHLKLWFAVASHNFKGLTWICEIYFKILDTFYF